MVRLVDVEEVFPVTLRFRPHGRYEYERTFFLPPDYPRELDKWEVENYVDELNRKFPDRGYVLEEVTVRVGGNSLKWHRRLKGNLSFRYWRIRRREANRYYVPIYIHQATGRIFVPQSFLKMRKARVARILVATLGGLGYTLPYED